jgi:hypothetical protein
MKLGMFEDTSILSYSHTYNEEFVYEEITLMQEKIKSRINKEVEIGVMSDMVKFLSLLNPLELCSGHFPSRLHQPGCIKNDPTVRVD